MTALELRPIPPARAEDGSSAPVPPPGADDRRHLRLARTFVPRTHRYRPVRHDDVIAGVLLSHKAVREQLTNP